MRAVNIMFDTLCLHFLQNYGNDWIHTPNFQRLSSKCLQFENFYGGSMPCMPARRELHTGMYNFLHRSWGPLEPFDFSVYEYMSKHGIYTHLVTDHSHYLEDGGATYHNRYSTWELYRGQEGDRWTPQDYGKVPANRSALNKSGSISVLQHYANLTRQNSEEEMSCVKTFRSGEEFIQKHKNKDNWYLQIESFDPHEPFSVPDRYRHMYDLPQDPRFDWPAYGPIDSSNNTEAIGQMRREYAALLTMCDHYLGEVLDLFDAYNLWQDTILIVNTDHGFLLGEHDLLGKNFPPMYQELIHLPFLIHIPGIQPGKRSALCQTIDIAPTLLDYFGINCNVEMDGKSLRPVIETDQTIHDYALFGVHGSWVGITDGKWKYFRANSRPDNQPYAEYTLMPTNMRGFFNKDNLMRAELVKGSRFTHGTPCLKVPAKTPYHPDHLGNLLFDLSLDPAEQKNLITEDSEIAKQFEDTLVKKMIDIEAPEEEFRRLGLHKPCNSSAY